MAHRAQFHHKKMASEQKDSTQNTQTPEPPKNTKTPEPPIFREEDWDGNRKPPSEDV